MHRRARQVALASAMAAFAGAAVAGDPPRGRRPPREPPTHAIVDPAALVVASGGATIRLRPGAAVSLVRRRRGRAVVRLVGDVRAIGTVDAAALGLYVARDVDVPDGRLLEGALVRVVRRGRGGVATVETTGAVRGRFDVPADALSAQRHEFVYRMPPNRHFVTPKRDTALYRAAASVGTRAPPVAVIRGGVEVVLLEQMDTRAKVRSHGPVEVEGWALASDFYDEGDGGPAPELLSPTHEVVRTAGLYATPDAAEPFAELRGGALVEASADPATPARRKVTTVGRVNATGWVDRRALRRLATPGG
ncbi:MAG: hypothetical protein D6689_07170 [Deltaproteobacteria bacterium]|nr:MAG: hypothetical protein D6689_07170 [Deltaproteobacteria bacterium]